MDESWCKQLTRLDLLKEEMVLQSFTAGIVMRIDDDDDDVVVIDDDDDDDD